MGDVCEGCQTETFERLSGGAGGQTRGSHGELEVLTRREVVVAGRLVADECELPAVRPSVAGQIDAEHLGVTRVNREQARQQPQEGRLARAVATGEEHDLSFAHVEIEPGERREATEKADGVTDTYDGLHKRSHKVFRSVRRALRRLRTARDRASATVLVAVTRRI
jgi:hypothetical protein